MSNYTETELQLILNKITSAQVSTITMNEGELYIAPDTAVYSVNNVVPVNGNVSLTIPSEGANKDLSNLSSTGNSKFQAPITGGASTITSSNLTTNRALVSNSSGKVAVSSVTLSELGYVSGVTSKIQTQLNNKVASNSAITGATKCKITYDSKGLVTSGTNLSASDIPDLSSTYYPASNPNNFTSNVGTVTSVNNVQPVNGNVTITIPDALPSQTGHSGDILTTDGTDASWADTVQVYPVIETYSNGASWYRVYSDGWCEQGGPWGTNTSNWATASVTFLVPFLDTNFNLILQGNWSDAGSSACSISARSTTGFTGTYANNQYAIMPSYWQACGYIR